MLDNQGGTMVANGTVPMSSFGSSVWGRDVDGDLDDDLLACTQDAQNAVITRFVNQGGVPTLSSQQTVAVQGGTTWHPGDLDGDGDQDLAARTMTGLQRFDYANGAFSSGGTIALGVPRQGMPPGLVDLDGDGHLDFVDSLSVWCGDGTFALPVAVEALSHAVVDWEGDGDVDLLRASGGLFRNDGSGAFATTGSTNCPVPGSSRRCIAWKRNVVGDSGFGT